MTSIRRLSALLILIASAMAIGQAQAQDEPATWSEFRPTGGPAYGLSVAQLPEDKGFQRLYAAGTEVLSTDRGDDWQHNPGTGPVTSVLAGSDGIVFVAADDGRGYRSTTNGRNWSRLRVRGDDPYRFAAVSSDYATDRTVFAITTDAWRLYRSGNMGSNWTEVTMELGVTEEYGAVAFSPLHYLDEWIFVGTSRGLFKWSVEDQSWNLVSRPDGNVPKFGSAGGPITGQGLVVPQEYGDDPDRREDPVVFTLFAYNADGLHRSDDDGATWRTIALPAEVEQVNGLAVSNTWPADPVLAVAAAGPGIVGAVSGDDGATWSLVHGPDGVIGASVAMSRDFARIPEKDFTIRDTLFLPYVGRSSRDGAEYFVGSREVFIGTDGDGVYRSLDAGATWEPTSPSYTGVNVTALAALGDADAPMLAGSEAAGLYRSEDGGRSWAVAEVGLPRGRSETIYAIRPSPAFATDNTVFLAASSGVWRSRDGGRSWQPTGGPKPVRSLGVSPAFADDRTVAAGAEISTDGGDSWTPVTETTSWYWSALAFSPQYATDHTIWYGTDAVGADLRYGLFKHNREDGSMVNVQKGQLSNVKIKSLFVLWADPSDALRVFVGGTTGLVVSPDGGEEWKRPGGQVGRTIADVIGRAVRKPIVRGIVLAATADGAAWSLDRGLSWTNVPRSGTLATAAAMSVDGRALVVGGPMSISRLDLDLGQ